MKKVVLLALALVYSLSSAASRTGTFMSGGETRSYTEFIPDTHSAAPRPLIIVLHGRTGSGSGMARLTDFNTLAERENIVMLYPDGLGGEWNYTRGIPGYPAGAPDDVRFLADLVDKISGEQAIDTKRIYVAGFSNGGFMTERLACAAPERYAAFASVSAAGFGGMNLVCPERYPASPVRLLFIHGTADTNIPWNGLARTVQGRSIPILYSVSDTLAFWADAIGCEADITSQEPPAKSRNPRTEIRLLKFKGCPVGSALELYAIGGGGHTWPGRPGFLPEEFAGVTSTELEATQAIWDFFFEQTPAH